MLAETVSLRKGNELLPWRLVSAMRMKGKKLSLRRLKDSSSVYMFVCFLYTVVLSFIAKAFCAVLQYTDHLLRIVYI